MWARQFRFTTVHVVAVVVLVLTSGCAGEPDGFDEQLWRSGPDGRAQTYEYLDEVLTPGMSRAEVRGILGNPDFGDGTTSEHTDDDTYRLPDGFMDPEWITISYDDADRYTQWSFTQG